MVDAALTFKILRLAPPALDLTLRSTFDLAADTAPEDADPSSAPPVEVDPSAAPYARRVQLAGGRAGGGVSASLLIPQAFGQAYIGQLITFAVVVTNTSAYTLHRVGLRVELHGERSKAVLLDTLPAPALPLLRPGEQQEAVVSHDIRELGPHTLSCAAAWAGADGERAYDSQAFRFTVANPVVVRTKHRLVAQDVLLEATLENRTKAPMLLDAVRLVPAPPYTAQTLDPPAPAAAAAAPGAGPLVAYADAVPLLPPEGGAKSFVFRLRRGEGQGEGAGESAAGGGAVADPGGGAALGRVEIRWRGPMGDPARLQTQLISMPPSPARDLRLSLGPLPPRVHVEQPFTAHVLIANASDRRLGPLKLSFTAAGSAGAPSVVMEGAQSVVVDEVAPRGTASVGLRLLPLAPGTQLVQGLLLTDDRDGRVFDTLRPAEVFVHGPAAAAL